LCCVDARILAIANAGAAAAAYQAALLSIETAGRTTAYRQRHIRFPPAEVRHKKAADGTIARADGASRSITSTRRTLQVSNDYAVPPHPDYSQLGSNDQDKNPPQDAAENKRITTSGPGRFNLISLGETRSGLRGKA